jgi:hypothetical protein
MTRPETKNGCDGEGQQQSAVQQMSCIWAVAFHGLPCGISIIISSYLAVASEWQTEGFTCAVVEVMSV